MELLVFLVSLVLKLWHLVLAGVLRIDAVQSWVASIVLLVVTVRGVIVPIAWRQRLSARRSVLMRPEIAALEKQYGESVQPGDVFALEDGKKAIHQKYGYTPLAGCIPPLIQIPIMIGLYRLILWIARPDQERLASGVGILSATDVEQFQQSTFNGIPIPVYLAMSDSELSRLGVSASAARDFMVPLLVLAVSFTAVNMIVSLVNSYNTMDWESKIARRGFKFILAMSLIVPGFLLWLGLHGPVPLALIVYWFTNNLWTLTQSTIILVILRARYPEGAEHKRKRLADRRELAQERARHERALRRIKRYRREIRRAKSRRQAWHLRKELTEYEETLAAVAEQQAARDKAIAKRQSQLRMARKIQRASNAGKHRRGKHRPKPSPIPLYMRVLAKVMKVIKPVRTGVAKVIPRKQRLEVPAVPPTWRL
ncbi:membrane protein insertase YidC [Corynebacterium breve]|uniref:Membrane protein insertase YidC n=1 Tax=Corynebacterium breve TaxID=3049799 RepID=A0ABY8VDN1_9CORY|nr:membrane protein insertase YidC [Corynebacterium breve]WIM67770.1 membrane protein insertase YidC [Corynebacterium breve]